MIQLFAVWPMEQDRKFTNMFRTTKQVNDYFYLNSKKEAELIVAIFLINLKVSRYRITSHGRCSRQGHPGGRGAPRTAP